MPCHSVSSPVLAFQTYLWGFSKSPCFLQRNVMLRSVNKPAYLLTLMFWVFWPSTLILSATLIAESLGRSRAKQTHQLPLVKEPKVPECTQESSRFVMATPQLQSAMGALLKLQPWHFHSTLTCAAQKPKSAHPLWHMACQVAGKQRRQAGCSRQVSG